MSEVSRETLLTQFFSERATQIMRYAEILASQGIERGLIGPKEADRIWERHIANCIPVTTLIPQNATVIDIGSGAGLPGIVVALARPDLTVTLLEPLNRRFDFLNEVVAQLELPIIVIQGRAQTMTGRYQVVTARAVAPLPKLLPLLWHLVAPGGSLLAIKGENAAAELAESDLKKVAHAQIHEISLASLPISRVIELRKGG
jgi:16S rRNA (guanine527-N7)-methyltransferase